MLFGIIYCLTEKMSFHFSKHFDRFKRFFAAHSLHRYYPGKTMLFLVPKHVWHHKTDFVHGTSKISSLAMSCMWTCVCVCMCAVCEILRKAKKETKNLDRIGDIGIITFSVLFMSCDLRDYFPIGYGWRWIGKKAICLRNGLFWSIKYLLIPLAPVWYGSTRFSNTFSIRVTPIVCISFYWLHDHIEYAQQPTVRYFVFFCILAHWINELHSSTFTWQKNLAAE